LVYSVILWGLGPLPIPCLGPGIDRASINRMRSGYSGHRHASFVILLNFGPLAGRVFVGGGPGGTFTPHFLCHDAWGMWGQS
jgi:hypothetical protein